MDWIVESKSDRYSISIGDDSERLIISEMKKNGEEMPNPKISFFRETKNGRINIEMNGIKKFFHVAKSGDIWWIHFEGKVYTVNSSESGASSSEELGGLTAPMPGTIQQIIVKKGQKVRSGQTLIILEAMKMEHKIKAPKSGEIISINYSVGDRVDMGVNLIEIG